MGKKKEVGAVLTLKDNFSATLKGIRREQNAFQREVASTKKELQSTFKKEMTARVNTTKAAKKIKQLRKDMKPLRKGMAMTIAYKDMASSKIKSTKKLLVGVAKTPFRPAIYLKDKASGKLNKLEKKLHKLTSSKLAIGITAGVIGGAALLGAAAGGMLGSGMALEKQSIAMEHFIGVNNEGMSAEDIKKSRESYMNDLRTNANATPFTTSEVIASGARAINVAGGDTKGAMELVKMAENMAALNPEKSLSDAMEAIADMKMGETERMKEFGFKISADDMKTMGGADAVIKKQIAPFFEGGAEKLSKSAGGLISTIKGKLGSRLQDTGFKLADQLKPQMESVIQFIDDNGPAFEVFGEKIGSGVGFVIDKFGSLQSIIQEYSPMIMDVIGGVSEWVTDKFGWIGGETGFLKEVLKDTFTGGMAVVRTFGKVVVPILNLAAEGAKLLYNAFKFAFPKIKEVVGNTWNILKPIIEGLGGAIAWIADKVGKVADFAGSKKYVESENVYSKTQYMDMKPASELMEVDNVFSKSQYINGSYATGLKRVPFDGFVAEVHKDERILTAAEAGNYNAMENGQGMRAVARIIIQKIADQIIIRDQSDIDAIAEAIYEKLMEAQLGMG